MSNKEKKPIYKKVWFWVVICLVLCIAGLGSQNNNDSTENSTNEIANEENVTDLVTQEVNTTVSEQIEEQLLAYEIFREEDLRAGGGKYALDVIVEGKPTVEDLENISKYIKEKYESYGNLWIGYYDYEEYIGEKVTLGYVEYDGNFDFNLYEIDWSLQVTDEEERKLAKNFYDTLNKGIDEEEAKNIVANESGKSYDEVNNTLKKWDAWVYK